MASKLAFLPFFCILFFLFSLSNAKYDTETIFKRLQGCHKGTKVQGLHYLKLYLASFGYLNYQHNPNHTNPENDLFDQELEAALKSYQNFYHLNASGTLDGPTVSQMILPRCGHPDKENSHIHGKKLLNIVSRYAFFPGNPRWPRSKSRLTYAFNSSYPNAYIPPVVDAFNTWASDTGYFTFSRVNDFTTSDLKISFDSGDHGDGFPFRGRVVAHAFAPTDGRFHYNADLPWSVGPGPVPNANDLGTVALHEIGHLLGLHHSQFESAIMWPTLPIGQVKGLSEDDIQGIRVLYGLN
ncbi:hypothetical protein QVD17_09726 [Tagetes erecta]|uniref:Peptidase metallopeptidase domain-containing protein n=1 Tax=Tagetes erecta TaxID=13708 RepID=A0AAD8NYX1_TARER|nr:hypothetical protein QVD17_09726 [Tagetes erecta]